MGPQVPRIWAPGIAQTLSERFLFVLDIYYDGNCLRVVKSISGGTTTVSIYSGSQIIAEYDNGAAPSAPSREYIYNPAGGATTGLLAMISGGATTYYHQDHLSVRLTTDAGGSVVTQEGHFPFGELWYMIGPANKWFFTSYDRDSESGLDYALARYYDSRTGTFCSADPLAGSPSDPQSWNRYPYGRNDPIDVTDPSRKSWWSRLLIGIGLNLLFPGAGMAAAIPMGGDGPPIDFPGGMSLDDAGNNGSIIHTTISDMDGNVLSESTAIHPYDDGALSIDLAPVGDMGRSLLGPVAMQLFSAKSASAAKKPCVKRSDITNEASHWNGTPYSSGGNVCHVGADCSGSVMKIYKNVGIDIKPGKMPSGSMAEAVFNSPSLFQTSNPQPGDIAYWSTPFHHVMINDGNGMMWGARRTGYPFGNYPAKWFGNGKSPTYLTSSQICPP